MLWASPLCITVPCETQGADSAATQEASSSHGDGLQTPCECKSDTDSAHLGVGGSSTILDLGETREAIQNVPKALASL